MSSNCGSRWRSTRRSALLALVAFGGCRCSELETHNGSSIDSGAVHITAPELPRLSRDASVRSLAPWIAPGDGVEGDRIFREYATSYGDALGDWHAVAWGTTVLDGARGPHRFAQLCSRDAMESHDRGHESAFLIEYAQQMWLLRWQPHGRSICNDPSASEETGAPPWESRTASTLEAVWGHDDENDLEEIGIRGGELVIFERRRFASAVPQGGERTPRHLSIPRAVADGGVPPAPVALE